MFASLKRCFSLRAPAPKPSPKPEPKHSDFYTRHASRTIMGYSESPTPAVKRDESLDFIIGYTTGIPMPSASGFIGSMMHESPKHEAPASDPAPSRSSEPSSSSSDSNYSSSDSSSNYSPSDSVSTSSSDSF